MTEVWPSQWFAAHEGDACHLCAEGRPDNPDRGPRFFAGRYCDAYLSRTGVQRGWGFVIWRGHHAVELFDLTAVELQGYVAEVATVAEAMSRYFGAIKMNVSFLGNRTPHLHAIIAARFAEDVAPARPIPDAVGDGFDPTQFADDCRDLASLLRSHS